MKKKPRKDCIFCESKIYRAKRRGQSKQRRGKNNITCSRPCARRYIKVQNHVSEKYRGRIRKLNNMIKKLEDESKK